MMNTPNLTRFNKQSILAMHLPRLQPSAYVCKFMSTDRIHIRDDDNLSHRPECLVIGIDSSLVGTIANQSILLFVGVPNMIHHNHNNNAKFVFIYSWDRPFWRSIRYQRDIYVPFTRIRTFPTRRLRSVTVRTVNRSPWSVIHFVPWSRFMSNLNCSTYRCLGTRFGSIGLSGCGCRSDRHGQG